MGNRTKIVAVLTAKPGHREALEALLRGMVAPSRAEPGNLRWDIWKDPIVSDRFVLDELYRDMPAVETHRESPHFLHYREQVAALAEREAFVVVPLDVVDGSDG